MKFKKQIFMAAIAIAACGCGSSNKSDNPLFNEFTAPFGIAPFSEITIDHYREGMLRGMEEQKAEIEAIVNNSEAPTFENTIAALDQCGATLRKVRGTFSPLSSSNSNDEIRALQKELSPLSSAHSDDINLNPALFARVKAVYEQKDNLKLTAEEQKVLENTYKRFVNSGAELSEAEKEKLAAAQTKVETLKARIAEMEALR